MKEKWRPISDYDADDFPYHISNFGNVRRHTKFGYRTYKPFVTNNNLSIKLRRVKTRNTEGHIKSYMIAREVAKAFIPNPEGYKYVKHKNGDKLDCRVENLYWAKNQQNEDDPPYHKPSKGWKKVCCKDLDLEFPCVKYAAEYCGVCGKTIAYWIKHGPLRSSKYLHGTYTWTYVDAEKGDTNE